MPYTPGRPPELDNLAELREYVLRELDRIAESQVEVTEVELREIHREPLKPRVGMLVYADGTDWDPGQGAGAYVYTDAGWQPVGLESTDIVVDDITADDITSDVVRANQFRGTGAPQTIAMLNAEDCAVSIANGASVTLPFITGMVIITEQTANGALAIYINGTGGVQLLATTNALFVAPTTTPGAGEVSVQMDGGVLKVFNNRGGTSNFRIQGTKMV